MLSDDRQTYFVHLITNTLEKRGLVSYTDKEKAMACVRTAVSQCIKELKDIEQAVREKILSLKRNVQEQSSEWEVLSSNYMEDELIRRGILSPKSSATRR